MPCLKLQWTSMHKKGRKNVEHVHGLSTCSDSKATGKGKERRHMCFETDLFLPESSVRTHAFLTKYRVRRHLGRYRHSLQSHGRTNFVEKNSPGGQHPWQTVRQSPQLHGTSWFQTCNQLLHSVFGTCTWYAVQLKGNVLQILSQFLATIAFSRAIPQPEPTHGVGDVPARIRSTHAWKVSSLLRINAKWGGSRHAHSERTGFEQRSKIAATYHQLLALGRLQQEEFCGTHWFRCCGTVVAPLPHHWTSLRTVSKLVKGVSENYRCLHKHTMMRFCTPRLLCQGPYCKWKIYVCSALPVPAESCKIARIFIPWWRRRNSFLRHSFMVRCRRPLHPIRHGNHPTRTTPDLVSPGGTTEAFGGKKRAACVTQMCLDFAIMRFCRAPLLCQGPYCKGKICVCSAFRVTAESCKIVRIFVLWASLYFAPFFAGPVPEAHTLSYTKLKPSH